MISQADYEYLRLLDQATDKAVAAKLLAPEQAEAQKKERREKLLAKGQPQATVTSSTASDQRIAQLEALLAKAGIADPQAPAAAFAGENLVPFQEGVSPLLAASQQKAALNALPPQTGPQPIPRGTPTPQTQTQPVVTQTPRAATQAVPIPRAPSPAQLALTQLPLHEQQSVGGEEAPPSWYQRVLSDTENVAVALEPAAENAIAYILQREGVPPVMAIALAQSLPALIASAKAALGQGSVEDAEMAAAEAQARLVEAERLG